MMMLTAENISRRFAGEAGTVLNRLSFSIPEGEIFAILGKSGCGKTTLLRTLGGFDPPDEGRVLLAGKPVVTPRPDVVMMFQSFDQLFPWYTLRENLAYALQKTGVNHSRTGALEQAGESLRRTGLGGFEDAYPHTLSGGMKQRGALARALCLTPRVLLMDEPFSSLDALTRHSMQELLLSLQRETGLTVVLVTHDTQEALQLGQTITVLRRGASELLPCEKSADALQRLLSAE